jgi:hypothetical protein
VPRFVAQLWFTNPFAITSTAALITYLAGIQAPADTDTRPP